MQERQKAKTGVAGLDDILAGGLSQGHVFLLEGSPGTGKTTIALQFLLEGARRGERGLYITLSETEGGAARRRRVARLDARRRSTIFELVPPESLLDAEQQQSLLYSSDLELGETTRLIFEAVERVKPRRVVLDSLSEIRLLAQSSLRYRRQILALKHYFARHGATVLLLDDLTAETRDKTVHSVAHGVIRLEELAPDYGAERRRLRVIKYRGQAFRGGFHDFTIQTGGVAVFPRLVAAEHRTRLRSASSCRAASPSSTQLLGGGIERGSSTLILGPAGTGKITARAAVRRGGDRARREGGACSSSTRNWACCSIARKALGIDLEAMRGRGELHHRAGRRRRAVARRVRAPGARSASTATRRKTVVIDSLNGYQAAMPEENS